MKALSSRRCALSSTHSATGTAWHSSNPHLDSPANMLFCEHNSWATDAPAVPYKCHDPHTQPMQVCLSHAEATGPLLS